jgi:DUF971 family protein
MRTRQAARQRNPAALCHGHSPTQAVMLKAGEKLVVVEVVAVMLKAGEKLVVVEVVVVVVVV